MFFTPTPQQSQNQINLINSGNETASDQSLVNSGTGVTMDPQSVSQVTNQENALQNTAQENSANIMQGTGAANNIQNISSAQATENQQEGGGGMPGMQQAISNKAQKNFAVSQGRLQQNADLQGQMMTNQNMNQATSQAIALSNAQQGVNNSLNQLQIQQNAATYATVSTLMTGAGKIAGIGFGSQNPGGRNMGTGSALSASESQFTNPTEESGYLGSEESSPVNYLSDASDVGTSSTAGLLGSDTMEFE